MNWYTYAANNPLRFVDPFGLWIYDIDEETGEMVATAEKDDTLLDLSGDYYGSTDFTNQIVSENKIKNKDFILEGQQVTLGDYNDKARFSHSKALRASFIGGGISYETLRGFSRIHDLKEALWFLPQEEEAIYNILYAGEIAKNENLISGKQYRELRNFYGVYTFADDFSSAEITADEAYIAGGIASVKGLKILGSAIVNSQFFQKVIAEDPKVAATVINSSPKTSKLSADMYKNLQTLVQDQRTWSSFQTYMQEWANREFVRQSAEKYSDTFFVWLELLMRKGK